MTNQSLINKYLQKVTSSPEFSSDTDQKLLNYLVSCSLKGETPKETIIAIEVFGKTAEFNPADSSLVRSHMYTLRKNLELYYRGEGIDDKIRFVIPKGHYKVELNEQKSLKSAQKKTNSTIIGIALLFVLIIVSLIAAYRLTGSFNGKMNSSNPIWSDFVHADTSSLIVIGDYFFFLEPGPEGNYRYVRDFHINSEQDLERELEMNENQRLIDDAYLGAELPWVFNSFMPYFRNASFLPEFTFASELSLHQFQFQNIIFIGSFKTLREFNKYYENLHFRYALYPHKILHFTANFDQTEEIVLNHPRNNDALVDYCIFAKIPSEFGKSIILFNSFHHFGMIEASKLVAQDDFVSNIEQRFLNGNQSFPRYFESLIRIEGTKINNLNAQVVYFEKYSR